MRVKNIIDFIGSRGATINTPFENFFLYWLNWICLLTSAGSFILFILTFIVEIEDNIAFYRFITILVASLYLTVIVLHHFKLQTLAFFHFALVIPLWYSIAIAFMGGNFSQSIAAASTLVIILFIYPKRDRIFYSLIVYNVLLFVLPSLYVNVYGPVIGINFPYDEILVFLLCCGWVSIAFIAFDRSRNSLINNLKSKNKILNARTNELQQFSYLMAHDIKTPIRNIVSFLGLLNKSLEEHKIDKAKGHLEFALKSSNDLNSLVSDVSKVIELRRNETVSDREDLDLNQIMEETLFTLKEQIEECRGEVKYEPLGKFYGNSSDLSLLFQNLISNGLKYNKSQTPIVKINSAIQNRKKLIVFKDNGIGIDKIYQTKIFEFFERLHVKSEFEGTGVGLGICNYIVKKKYNGQILVDSAKGQGSTFTVELPY